MITSQQQVEHQPLELHDAEMQSESDPHASDPVGEVLKAVAINFPEVINFRTPTPKAPPASTMDLGRRSAQLGQSQE